MTRVCIADYTKTPLHGFVYFVLNPSFKMAAGFGGVRQYVGWMINFYLCKKLHRKLGFTFDSFFCSKIDLRVTPKSAPVSSHDSINALLREISLTGTDHYNFKLSKVIEFGKKQLLNFLIFEKICKRIIKKD